MLKIIFCGKLYFKERRPTCMLSIFLGRLQLKFVCVSENKHNKLARLYKLNAAHIHRPTAKLERRMLEAL